MNIKYPKNVIVGFGAVAALLAATVLLGGYANSKSTVTEAPVKAECCQVAGTGCPMMASTDANPQIMAVQADSTDCPKTPCTEDCPKPCCAEDAPKGCYGSAETAGCCAAEATE